jgi:hypothetical protein
MQAPAATFSPCGRHTEPRYKTILFNISIHYTTSKQTIRESPLLPGRIVPRKRNRIIVEKTEFVLRRYTGEAPETQAGAGKPVRLPGIAHAAVMK